MLKTLLDAQPFTVSVDALMERVWGDYRLQVNVGLLHWHIKNLRKKLSLLCPNKEVISTIHQPGYKITM